MRDPNLRDPRARRIVARVTRRVYRELRDYGASRYYARTVALDVPHVACMAAFWHSRPGSPTWECPADTYGDLRGDDRVGALR